MDLRTAWRTLAVRHHRVLRLFFAAVWLGTLPAIAHAGIWNGGLCTVYQDVLDNELLEVVSLSALVGSIVLWLLDDGRSNIKTHVLRGVLGTLAVLNMPLLWAQVFNHGAACTGSI
ncbi:hypothetical protein [Burkholderia sp. Ax-1724]|uniref:hypothetical protein n=1 Tax=Burkholderia sp. Ax-1724 TaxID=2608336 RepID=UPI001424390D|nr:hypothetical protein [Burkholderia sp. Ax-1724]NIF54837.1 hypothetical protein [Burkholderia sp. Ax-1724]